MSNSVTFPGRIVRTALLILGCVSTTQAQVPAPTPEQESPAKPVALPAYLGVEFEESTSWGILAAKVRDDTAASKAGLVSGDLLLGIAGTVTESVDDARQVLREHWAGDRVQLVYRRGRELHVTDCVLGSKSMTLEPAHKNSATLGEVLEFLRIQPGQQVADIGFGNGWLTLSLAKATGLSGRVYAVEIDDSLVQRMRERKVPGITAVHSTPEDISLEKDCLDLAVLNDVAFHVNKPVRPQFYESVAKALRPAGLLAVFSPHGAALERIDELATFGFHPRAPKELIGLTKEQLDERLRKGIFFAFRREPPKDGH